MPFDATLLPRAELAEGPEAEQPKRARLRPEPFEPFRPREQTLEPEAAAPRRARVALSLQGSVGNQRTAELIGAEPAGDRFADIPGETEASMSLAPSPTAAAVGEVLAAEAEIAEAPPPPTEPSPPATPPAPTVERTAAPPAEPPTSPAAVPVTRAEPPISPVEQRPEPEQPDLAPAPDQSQPLFAVPEEPTAAAAAPGPEPTEAAPPAAEPPTPAAAAATAMVPEAEPEGEPSVATEEPAAAAAPAPELDMSSSEAAVASAGSAPPSTFAQAVTAASGAVPQLQVQEKQDLQASFPEIDRPSGMPPLEGPREPAPTEVEAPQSAPDVAPGSREGASPATQADVATGPLPGVGLSTTAPESIDDPGAERQVERFLQGLPTDDPGLSTSAGPRPSVDLTGEGNPALNEQRQEASDLDVAGAHTSADTATAADFGENAIAPTVPPERLRPSFVPTPPPTAEPRAINPPMVSAEVAGAFDQHASGWLAGQTGEALQQEQDERSTYETHSQELRAEGERRLAEETAKTRERQEKLSADARSDVAGERSRWREENEKIRAAYATESEAKRLDTSEQIDKKVTSTEKQADEKLTAAEHEAEAERRRTEGKAEAKKREAENKPRSWWDRVKGAISDFFNALKEAVVKLFDALRAFVKKVIDVAKAAARILIDAARAAIVGLIKAFGEALKLVVSIALAAFPEAAAGARAWIDDRVDTAVEAVNAAADALKAAAEAILDFVGEALDAALSLLQKAVLFVISVYQFLVIGLIEVMEKIGHLVDAARQMPDEFLGQVSEELSGMDLSKPLPIERSAPPAPAHAATAALEAGLLPPQDAAVLSKARLAEGDIAVDNVLPASELPPEFFAGLNTEDGMEYELPGPDDRTKSVSALQAEASGLPPDQAQSPMAVGPAGPATPEAAWDPEQDLQELMKQPTPDTCEPTKEQPAESSQVPEQLKKGPFSVGQRLRYLLDQMWKGIKQWFKCNWKKLLLGALGVLLGVVILEIVTGGAITAALPLIMEIISAIMLGAAIVRVTSYVGGYLSKGWGGDIAGAAKDLARGIAIAAIELVFALLFNIGAVIKSLKSGLKASVKALAQSVKATFTTAIKSARTLGKVLLQGAKTAVKNGKLLLRGLRTGFMRGVKSLRELGVKLLEHLRFRKFKITFQDGWFKLLGWINPWVVIMEGPLKGTITNVTDDMVRTHALQKGVAKTIRVGTEDLSVMLVSLKKTFPKDEYREIFRLFTGMTPKQLKEFVIHHVIERQTKKLFGALEDIFLNAPRRLVPFEKGTINRIVHLSEIRIMWNRMYPLLKGRAKSAIAAGLGHFASHTEEFIKFMDLTVKDLRAAGKPVTEKALRDAVQVFRNEHPIGKALAEAMKVVDDVEAAEKAAKAAASVAR